MNIAIIGCGAIAPIHIGAINKCKYTNLYCVCDNNKNRADDFSRDYNIKKYYDFDEVLNDTKVDAVHICTPHYLHYEMIKKSVEHGKIVVCEKPLTMLPSEYEELIKSCKDAKIYPILQNRFNNSIVTMKKYVEREKLGKLKCVKGILTWIRDEEYYAQDAWRGKINTEGGGVLINQALHTLDMMSYFAGEAKTADASKSNKSLKNIIEVEDTLEARILYSNDAIGVFYATNGYGIDVPMQFEVVFENGHFEYYHGKLYYNDKYITKDKECDYGKKVWGEGHTKIINNIYGSLKKNKSPQITLTDTEQTMRTLFAIYKSAEEGDSVSV